MWPSEQAVVRERRHTAALRVEAGIRHANDEQPASPQHPMRLIERDARGDQLLEAVPDEHGVERLALEAALLERKRTHVEAEGPCETRRVAADVDADAAPPPLP